jgi:hypothetical protein
LKTAKSAGEKIRAPEPARGMGRCLWTTEEANMANTTPNPNDPYVSPDDPYLTTRANDASRQARLNAALEDSAVQPDPELAEGPASGGKVAMFAVAIALVLGAVFYGLNSSTINQAGTATTAQNSAQSSPPAAPPGMRDVTPRANTEPGTTTGAAPARPATPPSAAPTGQDVNRSGNPPADNSGK